jgi:hypothetical protein
VSAEYAGLRPSEEIVPLQVAMVDVLRDQNLDPSGRKVATRRLLEMARQTSFPELACRALEHVVGMEIESVLADDPGFGDPVNRRLHEMLSRGEHTCSHCLRPLPDERTLETWRLGFEAVAWDRHLRVAS